MKKETLMTPEQFVYWLQGHFEMNPDVNTLTEKQIEMIRTHLNYVFTHVGTLVKQEPSPHGLGVKELSADPDSYLKQPEILAYLRTGNTIDSAIC